MKLISWNVNGLRALLRTGHFAWLLEESPDIFLLQETKASPEQLSFEVREPEGYHSYFASSTVRKGYGGVATYSKQSPDEVHEGLGIEHFDEQGRVLTLFFDTLAVINVYVPNGASKTASLPYKLSFYEELLLFMNHLRESGMSVVLGGDINVAHTSIDLARPEANKDRIGFLPEERQWMDAFGDAGYIDVFRYLHPDARDTYTYWDLKSRARDRNVGWRIDYWFVSEDIIEAVKRCDVAENVYGSDHAPLLLELK